MPAKPVRGAGALLFVGRRKSGYGLYGPPEGWLHAARVVQLQEGESAARSPTWFRQEDGGRGGGLLAPTLQRHAIANR